MGTVTLEEAYLQSKNRTLGISWSPPQMMTQINLFYSLLRRLRISAVGSCVSGSSKPLLKGSN